MKQYLHLSLAMVMALESAAMTNYAFAQNAQPTVGVTAVAGAGGQSSFLTAGDYNIIQANYTEAMRDIIKNAQVNAQEDREFLQAKGKLIGDSLRSLVDKATTFKALSQQATLGTGVQLTQVLSQANDINATVEKIQIDIQEASLISKDTLPSNTASIGNVQVTTGAASVIDMSKAMAPFQTTLDGVIAKLNVLTFRNVGHKGQFQAINENPLNPDLSRFPSMTAEEVQKALTDLQSLRIISAPTQRAQQFMADQIVMTTKKYIQSFGTGEFLRFRNENDLIAAGENYKTLEKFFFMRSYLRKKYGLQLGAIQSTGYPARKLNLENVLEKDLLLPVTSVLNSIQNQTAKTDTDLMAAYNNARQFVESYDRKLTPVLSDDAAKKRADVRAQFEAQHPNLSKQGFWAKTRAKISLATQEAYASFANNAEIMKKKPVILNEEGKDVAYNAQDTGVMARASGMFTKFTGQESTVQAGLAAMRLILADIREEVMLSQGDISAMQNYHDQRYYRSDEQTVRTLQTICDVDTKLTPVARQQVQALSGGKVECKAPSLLGGQTNGNNVLTTFRNLILSFESVEIKRAQDARSLQSLIDQSLLAMDQGGDAVDQTSGIGPVKKPGDDQ